MELTELAASLKFTILFLIVLPNSYVTSTIIVIVLKCIS